VWVKRRSVTRSEDGRRDWARQACFAFCTPAVASCAEGDATAPTRVHASDHATIFKDTTTISPLQD
jgi:hypothetical protein